MLEPQPVSPATSDPALAHSLGPSSSPQVPRVALGLIIFVAAKIVALILGFTHHLGSALVVFFSPDPWLFFQIAKPGSQGFGPAVTHFETTLREVWLTIDDGPDPLTTPLVLDLLDTYQAKATFFLIGEKVNRHPSLAREIVRRGHTVGNHTFNHPSISFWRASPRRTSAEIDDCTEALRQAGIAESPWFRPPVGIKNIFLHRCLAARGSKLIMWSARGYDGIRFSIAPLRQVIRRLRPGGIILVHEAVKTPKGTKAPIIEPLLAHLQEKGYRCVLPSLTRLRSGQK
jgi:peptidoglycan/xylan/chitin deacetylase (PgdA/CDA1 family)